MSKIHNKIINIPGKPKASIKIIEGLNDRKAKDLLENIETMIGKPKSQKWQVLKSESIYEYEKPIEGEITRVRLTVCKQATKNDGRTLNSMSELKPQEHRTWTVTLKKELP